MPEATLRDTGASTTEVRIHRNDQLRVRELRESDADPDCPIASAPIPGRGTE